MSDLSGPLEPGLQLESPNRNIAPITAELDSRGRLLVGGCLLSDLANQYGTPLYVLDEATIKSACIAYKNALNTFYKGKSLVLYASKANSSLYMSGLISKEGLGLDVVSAGELLTGLNGGVPGERIFLHGNNKSSQELLLAYENGATIIIDNQYDLDQLELIAKNNNKPVNLMLRFTPGIECHTHEYIKTGHLDSKFGFDPDQLKEVLLLIKNLKWARLIGLHAHIGSQIFELDPHRDLVEVMLDAMQLAKKIGHPVNQLNIGGGLGIKYIKTDDPPSIDQWVKSVSEALIEACEKRNEDLPCLLCEPGRSLIGNAGVTLYKIGSRKEIPGVKTYIAIDGGMSDNPRPITYQSQYTVCLSDRPLDRNDELVTIAGKHCESGDVLLNNVYLPSTKSGEILVVFATGAYNASMSSNYNRIPRPAAVLVSNGSSEIIQRREQPEDLLRYDLLPERFQDVG